MGAAQDDFEEAQTIKSKRTGSVPLPLNSAIVNAVLFYGKTSLLEAKKS